MRKKDSNDLIAVPDEVNIKSLEDAWKINKDYMDRYAYGNVFSKYLLRSFTESTGLNLPKESVVNKQQKPLLQPITKIVLALIGLAAIGTVAMVVYKITRKKHNHQKHDKHKSEHKSDSDSDSE